MIILTETTDVIQIKLGGAVAASELPIVSAWRDITTTDYTAGRTLTVTSGTSDVDAVPSPAASTQRVVDMINVRNGDTAEAVITIKFDANGTEYVLWSDTVSPGGSVHYADGLGFTLSGAYRSIKSFTVHGDAGANFAMTNATQAERLAGNSSRAIFMVDLSGYTQVRLRANQMVTSASANTPLFRAKYYTTFTTTVGQFLTLGASGEVELTMAGTGYRDTGWVNLVSGAQVDGCCIGFTELGGDGVADPALGATDILFR